MHILTLVEQSELELTPQTIVYAFELPLEKHTQKPHHIGTITEPSNIEPAILRLIKNRLVTSFPHLESKIELIIHTPPDASMEPITILDPQGLNKRT